MLTQESLKEFTKKFQTTEKNVIREYVQHSFLACLYKLKDADRLLFKGGTALHIVFNSPRFSEDLDFSGKDIRSTGKIDSLFLDALSEMEQTGFNISYQEAKRTSGGYLGIIHYELFGLTEDMKFEVSLRDAKMPAGEVASIVSEFTTPYTLMHLAASKLTEGKVAALLERKKPRDYYDLYFMLRHPALNKLINKKKLNTVLSCLDAEKTDFKKELSILLPTSHHMVLKNFKGLLRREIERYG